MPNYEETTKQLRDLLTKAVLEKEDGLEQRIRSFDTALLDVLRDVGRGVMDDVTQELSKRQEIAHRAKGFTVEKRSVSPFLPFSDE